MIKTIINQILKLSENICAGRLYYICLFYLQYIIDSKSEEVYSLYPALVESVIEVKLYLHKLSALYEGKLYQKKNEHSNIPCSDLYELKVDNSSGLYLCCRNG